MTLLRGFLRLLRDSLFGVEKPTPKTVVTKRSEEKSRAGQVKSFKPAPAEKTAAEPSSQAIAPSETKEKTAVDQETPVPLPMSGPLIKSKKEKIYIQVGLDFGTSCTKVVFSQIGRRYARAIDFGFHLPHYPSYCLPSVAAVNDKGRLTLGIEAAQNLLDKSWDAGFQRFKVIVAGQEDSRFSDSYSGDRFHEYKRQCRLDDTFTPAHMTAIYLAYAMNLCRKFIKGLPEYRDNEIDMAFNICMPIDHMQNNRVRSKFESIFDWAERIELKWAQVRDKHDLISTSYLVEKERIEDRKRVHAVPEAVASIASYIVSLRRQEGIHAVIDIGAGTTDISICNLMNPFGEYKNYWYAAKNLPFGTTKVERMIAEWMGSSGKTCSCMTVLDCLMSLKKQPRDVQERVRNELIEFKKSNAYYRTWGDAYKHLTKQTEWEKAEVFLCGGGSNLPHVDKIFSFPWWKELKVKYNVSRLPVPEDYKSTNIPIDRVSVAYGLSYPIPELEAYVLPDDSPNHTPPIIRAPERDPDNWYPP